MDRNEILHDGRAPSYPSKLDGDRFGHFCEVGVEFQVFPLTLVSSCDGTFIRNKSI